MPAPSTDLLHGVSLEQYAGVTTAITEGFPLPDILRSEAIEAAAWTRAEVAWKVRIAEGGADGPLLAALCEKRAIAEDTLARAVAPIDEDLGAWMSFLKAYGAHPAPFQMLTHVGLGLNDLARLERRWKRRMSEDAALPKQAAELAKKGTPPLPPLRVAGPVLQRFPWSAAPSREPSAPRAAAPKVAMPAETSLAPGKIRLYSYVAVKARLAESPGNEARVLEQLGLTDFATTDAGWQEILQGDPELQRDYRHLLDAQRAKLRAAAKQGRPQEAPASTPKPTPPREPDAPVALPIVRPPSALAGTALAVDIPRAALPFTPGVAPPSAPSAPTPPVDPPKPKPSLSGTALALDVPKKADLPFAASAPAATPPVTPPPPMTLEQHASLCCELAEAPEQAAETLARYQITQAMKAALDRHYADRFAKEPDLRAAWDRAHETYRAWWRAQRAGR